MLARWLKASRVVVLVMFAIVLACREGSRHSPTEPPALSTVTSVVVSGTASLTADGPTSQLIATATMAHGTTEDVTSVASWRSSNPAVATVSSSGLVTAVGAGEATIVATFQGKSGTLQVINRRRSVRSIGSTPFSSFASLSGNWSGTWTDTRYNVSGAVTATFVVNGSTATATGTIDLTSLGLGVESGSGTGTINGQTLAFTFSASTVGNGSGTLGSGGAGSGAGTVTGTLNFGAFTFNGNVNDTTISGTFNFTSPTGGHGNALLTKQ